MDPRSSKPNTRPTVRRSNEGAATDPTAVRAHSGNKHHGVIEGGTWAPAEKK